MPYLQTATTVPRLIRIWIRHQSFAVSVTPVVSNLHLERPLTEEGFLPGMMNHMSWQRTHYILCSLLGQGVFIKPHCLACKLYKVLYSFAVAAYHRALLLSLELVGGGVAAARWIRTGMECGHSVCAHNHRRSGLQAIWMQVSDGLCVVLGLLTVFMPCEVVDFFSFAF